MENITLTKITSAFKDNYQKYNIPIFNKDFLDISLERAKNSILDTLINISTKSNRFKANIVLELDDEIVTSDPLELKCGRVVINKTDDLIINMLEKYEDLLEFSNIKHIYIYTLFFSYYLMCFLILKLYV